MTSDGYPLYRRRQDGKIIQKGGAIIDNRSVVPDNKYLCKVFDCHINVEVCSPIHSVKYLYKYVYKGHDRVQAQVGCPQEPVRVRDEPQQCLDARYISASEFYWRICEFSMQSMYPSVCQLQLHLENMQGVLYDEGSDVHEVLKRCLRTTLTEWMRYNQEHLDDELARTLLYCDFPSYYTRGKKSRAWTKRKSGQCVGRI